MGEAFRILVIEDEEIWRHNLREMLAEFGFEVSASVGTFEDAVIELNRESYDLILVDVNLQGKKMGIELGRMIGTLYRKPFIFITGSEDKETLSEASEVGPSAFLIKPPNPGTLFVSIQNALSHFEDKAVSVKDEQSPEFIFVKQGNRYKKILWKDILTLTSEKNYTVLFNVADKQEYYIRSTLPKTLKWIVPAEYQSVFMQINRNQAVNIGFIDEISGETIKTVAGNFVLGETYARALKSRIHIQP